MNLEISTCKFQESIEIYTRCRQLYGLHIKSDATRYFLFQIISFKKYFYVSLGNIFYCFFVEAPEQLPSSPLNLALL